MLGFHARAVTTWCFSECVETLDKLQCERMCVCHRQAALLCPGTCEHLVCDVGKRRRTVLLLYRILHYLVSEEHKNVVKRSFVDAFISEKDLLCVSYRSS